MHYYVGENKNIYVESGNTYKRIGTDDLSNRIAQVQKKLMTSVNRGPQRAPGKPRKASAYTGTKKSLIILVQFSDVSFSMDDPQAFYSRVANEQGFSEGNFKGSVADYFKEQSNGQFNLEFDVVGPYTLNTVATYGANGSDGKDDTNKTSLMISQACAAAAQDGVDFTKYDWDGDGNVEEVYVLYAGKGEADGGDENTVWPHKYQITPTRYGGATVSVYACSNEINGGGGIAGIGTICHEFSHCLGFPDMYDINYSENGQQYGMGSWDLMCSGSYNDNGYQPAGYTAYEKFVAGWNNPIDVSNQPSLNVTNLASLQNGGDSYIMYNPGNQNEYYIWENRQQEGFNASLPASGFMVYHIDYDPYIWNNLNCPNSINSYNDHERITFFAADNNRSDKNEYGDTYPYNGNNTLNNGSQPAGTVFNTNTETNNKFMNINLAGMNIDDNGLGSFNFINLNVSGGNTEDLFYESFDKCAGTGGNDGQFTPTLMTSLANGAFTPDNTGWSTGNAFGGNLCARFGTTSNGRFSTTVVPGVAVSPTFSLNGTTTLTFKAAPFSTDGTTLTVTANGATLSQQSFTMVPNQWSEYTTTITGTGDVTLTFSGAGRFFLDEVKVANPTTPTAINSITKAESSSNNAPLFNLAGQRVSNNYHGIVIRNGKKYINK